MIAEKQELILQELQEGTGAAISVAVNRSGLRTGLRIWFGDLDEGHGPTAELRPFGLKGHRVDLTFGNFSGEILQQIKQASDEDVQLARALVTSIRKNVELDILGGSPEKWNVSDGAFQITAKIRDLEYPNEDTAVVTTCREVIVPMMAAMAELIGYDVVEEKISEDTPVFEGAILQSVIKRRERNPRNRLLCIRIHGERCVACSLDLKKKYGVAGSTIEVHHLEPLASLEKPHAYNPLTDLVPLCPNCHRAVHTRRPTPITIDELRKLMDLDRG
ncbi:HNH endonuclease [Pseudomonas neuropathica]|uniref:HNH endonuclease n=1 Tax=Pseudomonas neuropathica TaxID=2730425 RepID=UPI003EB870A2